MNDEARDGDDDEVAPAKPWGFARLSPEERKAGATKASHAARAKGVGHRYDSKTAREAGLAAEGRHRWSSEGARRAAEKAHEARRQNARLRLDTKNLVSVTEKAKTALEGLGVRGQSSSGDRFDGDAGKLAGRAEMHAGSKRCAGVLAEPANSGSDLGGNVKSDDAHGTLGSEAPSAHVFLGVIDRCVVP